MDAVTVTRAVPAFMPVIVTVLPFTETEATEVSEHFAVKDAESPAEAVISTLPPTFNVAVVWLRLNSPSSSTVTANVAEGTSASGSSL